MGISDWGFLVLRKISPLAQKPLLRKNTGVQKARGGAEFVIAVSRVDLSLRDLKVVQVEAISKVK
jgi:hypothetical protein